MAPDSGPEVVQAKFTRGKWHYLVHTRRKDRNSTRWMPEHSFTDEELRHYDYLRRIHIEQLTPEETKVVALMIVTGGDPPT